MRLIKGLLDYSKPPKKGDVYIFTGNSYIRQDGALVMGRGAAKQVRDTYPCVQYSLGEAIAEMDEPYHVFGTNCAGFSIYIFQVKYHFRDDADLVLIEESTTVLMEAAIGMPNTTFHMNYPGIGNGKLEIDVVNPLLKKLPDNVLIYR